MIFFDGEGHLEYARGNSCAASSPPAVFQNPYGSLGPDVIYRIIEEPLKIHGCGTLEYARRNQARHGPRARAVGSCCS